MRSLCYALLVGTPLLFAAPAAGSGPAASDLPRLQGWWDLTACETEREWRDNIFQPPPYYPWLAGMGIEGGVNPSASLNVQQQFFSSHRGVDLVLRQAEVRLDPSKDPRAIDLTFGTPGKDRALLGIYKIEGDTFTLCLTENETRPTEFRPKKGQVVLQYTRQKNRGNHEDLLNRAGRP